MILESKMSWRLQKGFSDEASGCAESPRRRFAIRLSRIRYEVISFRLLVWESSHVSNAVRLLENV